MHIAIPKFAVKKRNIQGHKEFTGYSYLNLVKSRLQLFKIMNFFVPDLTSPCPMSITSLSSKEKFPPLSLAI